MANIGVGVLQLGDMIAAMSRSESAWNPVDYFCEQVMFAKETAESEIQQSPGPASLGTGQVPQATQAPEIADPISACLGMTDDAICHPSKSRTEQ